MVNVSNNSNNNNNNNNGIKPEISLSCELEEEEM
jgi:hypothetical protein